MLPDAPFDVWVLWQIHGMSRVLLGIYRTPELADENLRLVTNIFGVPSTFTYEVQKRRVG